tara:strand:+ start:144 stop:929 length:786 start_codon:yes stop_codon:yes gene_type:complete
MSLIKNIKKINDKIFKAVYDAGEIASKFNHNNIKHWYKSKNQPVTEADIEINSYLKKFFEKHTPEIGWLSEETKDDYSRFKKKGFWCLDPIDGTRSFIHGKPEFAISLALVFNSKPIFGIIFNPKTNEMFFAEKGSGAFCNKKKISVRIKKIIENIAISNSEAKKIQEYEIFNKLSIVKMGSIAYKIALVAKGEIDIAVSFTNKNDWDLAAASLILEEAGGKISNIQGELIKYNTKSLRIPSVIACNKIVHCNVIEKILNS